MQGSESDDSTLAIDVGKIDFPTDKLAISALRKKFPSDFDFDWHCKNPDEYKFINTLVPALFCERELAARVYESGVQRDLPHHSNDISDEELKEMLHEDYLELGVSSGLAHSQQLFRDIESQAQKQLPRSRG